MDAQQFITAFGYLVSAPEGLQQIRGLILGLAIKGSLLSNNARSDSAIPLHAVQSNTMVRRKSSRRTAPLSPVRRSELSFRIPDNWAVQRLGDICEIIRGVSFPASQKRTIPTDDGVACLRTTNVQAEIEWNDLIYIDRKLVKQEDQWLYPGDTIISMANSYELVGKVALVREVKQTATFGAFLAAIRPYVIEPEYVYLVLRSPYMQSFMRRSASQTTNIANISLRGIRPIPIPIPPLEEQQLIVAKVNDLMRLCDKLELQQKRGKKLRTQTRTATVDALSNAESITDLRSSWDRLQSTMRLLLDEPEDVERLKITILDLGVHGRLNVRQSSVTPATLERLRARKEDLANRKILKREKPIVDFPGVHELRRSIPETWSWCRLNDIASVVRGGSPRPAGDPRFYGGDIPFLKVADVTRPKGMFVENYTTTIKKEGLKKTREISKRTVLLTNSGATLGIPRICTFRTTFNDGIAAFIELADEVFDEFLYFYLKSKSKWLLDIASRGQGQPNLNTDIIRAMWFPLPPMVEQQTIVHKIKMLLRLCEDLTARQERARTVATACVLACVSAITGIDEDKEKMKVPNTEIVSTLRIGISPERRENAPLATILVRNHGELSAKALWGSSGMEIDGFYQQLKIEMANGWITQPEIAYVKELETA